MATDFPAAHSLDTDWFAVDQHGHIAVFMTFENGHAPEQVQAGDIDTLFDLWDFWPGITLPLPGIGPPVRHEEVAARVGLFMYRYNHSFDPITPYQLAFTPEVALHVDQLPPRFRGICLRCRFSGVDFSQTARVQPLEHGKCNYWYRHTRVAYLLSDGRTVKPIPGQEERFRAFWEELRSAEPERARQLYFEGLDTAASPETDAGRAVRGGPDS